MKLASHTHKRDGQLVVVSTDLKLCVKVPDIAFSLQYALDNWRHVEPQLEHVYSELNQGRLNEALPFSSDDCTSPLPRAYQWADASAYLNHVELVRKARGAEMPESFYSDPLMYQGGSDTFLAPTENIPHYQAKDWGLDFEAEVAVITDDVPMGVQESDASKYIKLIMLVNDVSLRHLIPSELAKGFGFFQSKPSTAFSPVCVTPCELGVAWKNDKVHLPVNSYINDCLFGCPNAGIDMNFNFSRLISHAAKTRELMAGSIIGSGTVSNKYENGPGKTIAQGGVGYSCIAEQRMVEKIVFGKMTTNFLMPGDKVKIEMLDEQQCSIFSAIDQYIV